MTALRRLINRPFFIGIRAYRLYQREQRNTFRPDYAIRWGLAHRRHPERHVPRFRQKEWLRLRQEERRRSGDR